MNLDRRNQQEADYLPKERNEQLLKDRSQQQVIGPDLLRDNKIQY